MSKRKKTPKKPGPPPPKTAAEGDLPDERRCIAILTNGKRCGNEVFRDHLCDPHYRGPGSFWKRLAPGVVLAAGKELLERILEHWPEIGPLFGARAPEYRTTLEKIHAGIVSGELDEARTRQALGQWFARLSTEEQTAVNSRFIEEEAGA